MQCRLLDDAGQLQQRFELNRLRQFPFRVELLELLAIGGQGGFVQAIIVGRTGAIDAQRNLHRSPLDVLADDRVDVGFQRRVDFAGTHRELEVPAVDRAHLNPDGQTRLLVVRFAEARHAQQHSKNSPAAIWVAKATLPETLGACQAVVTSSAGFYVRRRRAAGSCYGSPGFEPETDVPRSGSLRLSSRCLLAGPQPQEFLSRVAAVACRLASPAAGGVPMAASPARGRSRPETLPQVPSPDRQGPALPRS